MRGFAKFLGFLVVLTLIAGGVAWFWAGRQPGPTVLRGFREVASETTRDVQVRLDPPRASVLSTFHYVNLGGAEFVVYRATPADVESGVRVGDRVYPGFPGTAVGISDPAVRVAF